MKRYVHTFRRFWLVALLPIIVLPLAAYKTLGSSARTYSVSTNIWADQGAVSRLIYTDPYSPPAVNLANYLTELLASSSFDLDVARHTPVFWSAIKTSPQARGIASTTLQGAIQALPVGSNLVTISYTSPDPKLGAQVLPAFLAAASQQTQAFNLTQTNKAVSADEYQLRTTRAKLKQDSATFSAYLSQHGIAATDVVSASQSDPTLATLYQQVQNDQTAFQTAQEQLGAALTQHQSFGNHAILNTFQMIDPPATVPLSNKKQKITDLGVALLVGLIIGGGFIVLKTAMDRSLRFADEVPDLLGLPLLATIPSDSGVLQSERRGGITQLPKARVGGGS